MFIKCPRRHLVNFIDFSLCLLAHLSNRLIQFDAEINTFYSNSRKLLSVPPSAAATPAAVVTAPGVNGNNVYGGGSHNSTSHDDAPDDMETATDFALISTGTAEALRSSVGAQVINCTSPAIDEFPPDGFSRWQRQRGWITLHILFAFYCFWFLAIICDDYFVPAIESLCASKSPFRTLESFGSRGTRTLQTKLICSITELSRY